VWEEFCSLFREKNDTHVYSQYVTFHLFNVVAHIVTSAHVHREENINYKLMFTEISDIFPHFQY
jgi:hypothetical protein